MSRATSAREEGYLPHYYTINGPAVKRPAPLRRDLHTQRQPQEKDIMYSSREPDASPIPPPPPISGPSSPYGVPYAEPSRAESPGTGFAVASLVLGVLV